MTKNPKTLKPIPKPYMPDLTNVGDVWFSILSPLNRAYAYSRNDDVRAEIAAAYIAVTKAFGFGGYAKIRRTPRKLPPLPPGAFPGLTPMG